MILGPFASLAVMDLSAVIAFLLSLGSPSAIPMAARSAAPVTVRLSADYWARNGSVCSGFPQVVRVDLIDYAPGAAWEG